MKTWVFLGNRRSITLSLGARQYVCDYGTPIALPDALNDKIAQTPGFKRYDASQTYGGARRPIILVAPHEPQLFFGIHAVVERLRDRHPENPIYVNCPAHYQKWIPKGAIYESFYDSRRSDEYLAVIDLTYPRNKESYDAINSRIHSRESMALMAARLEEPGDSKDRFPIDRKKRPAPNPGKGVVVVGLEEFRDREGYVYVDPASPWVKHIDALAPADCVIGRACAAVDYALNIGKRCVVFLAGRETADGVVENYFALDRYYSNYANCKFALYEKYRSLSQEDRVKLVRQMANNKGVEHEPKANAEPDTVAETPAPTRSFRARRKNRP